MFEKYVERVLNRYLDPYLDGIGDSSGVSIVRGDAVFKNLSLKLEAFEFLKKQGWQLDSSSLARLHVRIPWSALTTGKISLELDSIVVDVSRTENEIPAVEGVLAEYRAHKQQRIETKVEELLELEKVNSSNSNRPGFTSKLLHRVLQNLTVTVAGGVVLRMMDLKHDLTFGVMVGKTAWETTWPYSRLPVTAFRLYSREDGVTDTTKFLKRCEVSDLAAFVRVGQCPIRYLFTPTTLMLDLDHIQNTLEVRLEILHSDEEGSVGGGILLVSRRALRCIMTSLQELMAWQAFVGDLVKEKCGHVRVDAKSLKEETHDQYTLLYRRKQGMVGGDMDQTEAETLQAIEDAVPARHIALWRIQVGHTLKRGMTTIESDRKWWFWRNDSSEASDLISEEDWADIMRTVEQEHQHLADLAKPDCKRLTIKLARFGFNFYEDEHDHNIGRPHAEQLSHERLCVLLKQDGVEQNMLHSWQLLIADMSASTSMTMHVHDGAERVEWSWGTHLGMVEIKCDQDTALQYDPVGLQCITGQEESQLLTHGKNHISLVSRFQDNGSELITIGIKLPPVRVNVSPQMVAVAQKLVQLDLPPPPVFESGESNRDSQQMTEWQDWRDEQQEKIMETAFQELERVKQSTLRFAFDISISAPQFTVHLDDERRVHMDFGHLRCVSEEEVTAQHFNVQLDLTNTQVKCISTTFGESISYSVLDPISLEISLAGDSQSVTSSSSAPKDKNPLDVTTSIKLDSLQLRVNPQCAHLFWRMADVYKPLLGESAEAEQSIGRQHSSSLEMVHESSAAQSAAFSESVSVRPPDISESQTVNLYGSVTVALVSLSLLDVSQKEVARLGMQELQGKGDKLPTNTSCQLSLRHFLVEVAHENFVSGRAAEETKEKALDMSAESPEGTHTRLHLTVCPIIISWRKQDVATLVAVVQSYMPPAPKVPRSSRLSRNNPERERRTSSGEESRKRSTVNKSVSKDANKSRMLKPSDVRPESYTLASRGLDTNTKLPLLQAEKNTENVKGANLNIIVDLFFGGVEFELFVEAQEIQRVCAAWCGNPAGPLMQLRANGVGVHIEQFKEQERRGQVTLESISLDYDGECVIYPWRGDKAVFECDFRGYMPIEKGGPSHSLCAKVLLRTISIVFFMKHLDSLLYNLNDNILGAVVYHAAAQAAEVAKEAQKGNVILWNCLVESPVIQMTRDVSVLFQSPRWGTGKCMPPASTRDCDLNAIIGRSVEAARRMRAHTDDCDSLFECDQSPLNRLVNTPTSSPTGAMLSFDQCLLLLPGTIQAKSTYELDTLQLRFDVAFRNCHVTAVDCEGYATGRICEMVDWDLTVRPEQGTSPGAPLQLSVGIHVEPIKIDISQSQVVFCLDIMNENVAYTRYFPFDVVAAPEGAEAADVPLFCSLGKTETEEFHEEDDGGYFEEDSSATVGTSRQTSERLSRQTSGAIGQQFEYMRVNVRMEFELIQMTGSFSTPGEEPGDDAQHDPLVCMVGENLRSTFDLVMYYEGKALLFSYGLFMNSIFFEDCRSSEFRKSVYTRCVDCSSKSEFREEGCEDTWKLIVDCEESKTPWKPHHAAFHLVFTRSSDSQYDFYLGLEKPRWYCASQFIVDTVMIVVNSFMASSLVQYSSAVLPEPPTDFEPHVIPKPAEEVSMIMTFCFEVNGTTFLFGTDHEDLTAPLIELETTWRIVFDYDDEGFKFRQLKATDNIARRTEGLIAIGMIDRSHVQLIKISEVSAVGEYIMGPQPQFSMSFHSLPISVRLSCGDVPHLLAVASNFFEDARRGPMAESFPLDRGDSEGCAGAAKEKAVIGKVLSGDAAQAAKAVNKGVIGACGVLRLRVLDVLGASAPGRPAELRSDTDDGVWITVNFEHLTDPVVAPWDKLMKLAVPKNKAFREGKGARAEDGVMVELVLHRGRPPDSELLGTLIFPVTLCAGNGLKVRRLMRSTCAKHSLFMATEGGRPLELDFQARFEPRHTTAMTVCADSAYTSADQDLDDFLKQVPQLEDFVDGPVPPGPSRIQNARPSRERVQTGCTLDTSRQQGVEHNTLATRVFMSIEAIEGLFLDDCRAKALPVLRFCAGLQSSSPSRLKSKKEEGGEVLLDGMGAEGAGGMLIQFDPWVPLGEANLQPTALYRQRQRKGLSVRVEECTIGIQYLNSHAGCWEPFLEQWSFDFFFDASEEPSQGKSHAVASSQSGFESNFTSILEVTVVSFTPLLLNVTPPLCSLAAWLLNHKEVYLAEFRGETNRGGALNVFGDARYRLVNLAGEPVRLAFFRPGSEQVLQSGQSVSSSDANTLRPGATKGLSWQVFQPSEDEVQLDSLLGRRTAEDWRESAAEAVGCAIEFDMAGDAAHTVKDFVGSPSGKAMTKSELERKRLVLPISSASEGVLPLGRPGVSAVCEVVAPHPSYHLLLISSGLRVFNHTDRPFELRFIEAPGSKGMPLQNLSDGDAPFAAPLSILPEKVAIPVQIAHMLHLPSASTEAESAIALAARATDDASREFLTRRNTGGLKRKSTVSSTGKADPVQRLEPQHFCSAPPIVASSCFGLQLRLPGGELWSNVIQLEVGEEQSREIEVIIEKSKDVVLRFRSCIIFSSLTSVAQITSVHIYSPLRILNATPVRLIFAFRVASTTELERPEPQENTVTVEPLSDYDLPPQFDPKEPYSLWLALDDRRVSALSGGRDHVTDPRFSADVPLIFDTTIQTEELVALPISEDSSPDAPRLFLTVRRGLTCSVACSRWLINRTFLGLRMLHLQQRPTQESCPLPQVERNLTLLGPVAQKPFRTLRGRNAGKQGQSFPELRRMRYYLALRTRSSPCWSVFAPVTFPENGKVSFVSLDCFKGGLGCIPVGSAEEETLGYPVHVCLSSEDLNLQVTLGTPCQIISVLPQVMVFNHVFDDAIVIRAKGDSQTEVTVAPNTSVQFLQWRSNGEVRNSGGRAKLKLEFRPSLLKSCANWSRPLKPSDLGVFQVVFTAAAHSTRLPNILRMYLVEVVEQNGVICVTINRGSKCELQNFSSIVKDATVTLKAEKTTEERFTAKTCETVEFAWPSTGNELQLRLVLQWARSSGGSSTACIVPDLYKPGQSVILAPGGWHVVVIETGRTGEISWLRVSDLAWTSLAGQSMPTFHSTVSKMVMGTFVAGGSKEDVRTAKLKFGLSLSSIGVSLVSQQCERELLYAEVQNFGALLGVWEDMLNVEFLICGVQVDSQLLDSEDIPVLLVNRGESGVPAVRGRLTQRLPISHYSVKIDKMGIQTDTLEVNINDRFLLQVVDTVKSMMALVSTSHGVTREQIQLWHDSEVFSSPPKVPMEVTCSEFVFLGLEVNLWARLRLSVLPVALRQAFYLVTAGENCLEVNGARIQLSPEVFDNIQGAAPAIAKTFWERYKLNFLISLGSIFGRSSLLKLPALPIRWGRSGMGEAMRAVDFLIHRTSDVFELLMLDQQYVRRKRRQRQQRLNEIIDLRSGLSIAALHLGAGLMHITDIFREPIAGAKKDGFQGFVTGLGRGLVGTAVKPIVEVGSGARSITHAFRVKLQGRAREQNRHVVTRRRPPRVMYSAGGIREYDEAAALLTLEVATASPVPGTTSKDRAAVEQARYGITNHVVVKRSGATPYIEHLLLLLTPAQLLLVNIDRIGIAVRWSLPLAKFCGAQASSHGVIVWGEVSTADWSSSESREGHQVPSADVDVIQSILRMLQLLQPQGGKRIRPTRGASANKNIDNSPKIW